MAEANPAKIQCDADTADLFSNELELTYSENSDAEHRKKLGQFFTPYSVASFMAQWFAGLHGEHPDILDPCAGLGVFERALSQSDPDLTSRAQFTLWEKDPNLLDNISAVCGRLDLDHSVVCDDYLGAHSWSKSYDGVIANPPYYKHHFIKNKEQVHADISRHVGMPFSIQTNIYCWFLVKALHLLNPNGRLAFIIPTEFFNANYGKQIKNFLLESGALRYIVSVCYKSRAFENAATTACILLCERNDCRDQQLPIRFYSAKSVDELINLEKFLKQGDFVDYRITELNVESKWRAYFPGVRRVDTRSLKLVPFSTYGRFSRGIATGSNEFFAVNSAMKDEHDLADECLIPCVTKSSHAPGKRFSNADFQGLHLDGKRVFLFDGEATTSDESMRYIEYGESEGFDERYLTKNRSPWYALEKRQPSKIWACVFGRGGLRFIWNDSDCISLTCFHVFAPSQFGQSCLQFLYLYLNTPLGRDFLELEKREYGDGLEKFEPNDINKSLAPNFALLSQSASERLADLQSQYILSARESVEESTILVEANELFSSVV